MSDTPITDQIKSGAHKARLEKTLPHKEARMSDHPLLQWRVLIAIPYFPIAILCVLVLWPFVAAGKAAEEAGYQLGRIARKLRLWARRDRSSHE